MRIRKNVSNVERVASIAAGLALGAWAIRSGRGRGWTAPTAAGLLSRGLTGFCPVNAAVGRNSRSDDTREALSGPKGLRLQEQVLIRRPPSELYQYWRSLERLPEVMPDLESVERIDDRRSHWVMRGPAGVRVEWGAEIINDVPGELIGWRSLPGADVVSAGSVRFRPTRRGTQVVVTMQYAPPGGKLGAGLAWLAGDSAASKLRENLERLKTMLESQPSEWKPNGREQNAGGLSYAMETTPGI